MLPKVTLMYGLAGSGSGFFIDLITFLDGLSNGIFNLIELLRSSRDTTTASDYNGFRIDYIDFFEDKK